MGPRWVRLVDGQLGGNIFEPEKRRPLQFHVHTFRELSESPLWATWGTALATFKGVLGGRNPYIALSLADQVGVHSQAKPEQAASNELLTARITALLWHTDERIDPFYRWEVAPDLRVSLP